MHTRTVYTYGSVIAVFMMAMSLLCLVAVPRLRGSKHGKTYKAMRLCVMASGASALFCYCVLFLMMEVSVWVWVRGGGGRVLVGMVGDL